MTRRLRPGLFLEHEQMLESVAIPLLFTPTDYGSINLYSKHSERQIDSSGW